MSKEKTTNEITLNGVVYIPKSEQIKMADPVDGLQYVMIRTYSAGVFAGYLKKRTGQEVELLQARRIWQWQGAASLSQLAMEGTSKPEGCKFPQEVDSVILLQTIEIIPISEKAEKSIKSVAVWNI